MTDAQALSTLLTLESFMLAVVSLTATFVAPGRQAVADLPVPGVVLAMAAAVAVGVLGLGAALAWCGMYTGGSLRPCREVAIAVVILLAVVFQPVFAVLLALGVRKRK